MRSAGWIAGPMLGLLAACGGHGGRPEAPPTSSDFVNDSNCALQYSLTDARQLSGTDPLLAQQWHLDNDDSASGQTGIDLNAFDAWQTTRGESVRVAVIDDAIEVTHEDIAPNVVADASYNYRQFNRGSAYPMPCSVDDDHGTSVAGLIVARDFNARGVAGVAPRASLVAYNALATSNDADVAEALNRDLSLNAVYNNSWGSADDGSLHPAQASFIEAVENGIADGRDGKGAIYVFPSGNGGSGDNSNYDGYVNKLGVITACAVDINGRQPFYGERGANLLVCAPSSNGPNDLAITTTTLQDQYTSDFTGTSASTPMVSGVVALMLAANPDLTWRDIRLILASTAGKNHFDDLDWSTSFGLNFSHKYGFGLVDADAAVRAAQNWNSVGGSSTLLKCGPYQRTVRQSVPDRVQGSAAPTQPAVSSTITVPACGIGNIEFVAVRLTAEHPTGGDLRISLRSPRGLLSELADERLCNQGQSGANCGDYDDYAFGSVRHMNEPVNLGSGGNWTLGMTDMISRDVGTFVSWSITFFGRP